MLAFAVGACLTGCPAALILGGAAFGSLLQRSQITIKGEVDLSGRLLGKVGALKFFEGDAATATYRMADADTLGRLELDFGRDPRNLAQVQAPPGASGSTTPAFQLTLQSQSPVAQWLVVAWEDVNKDGRMGAEEARATESYQITKSGGAFFGFRSNGLAVAPLAATGVVTFSEAEKVKYRFTLPAVEEAPVATS